MPDFFVDTLDDPLLDAGAKAFTAVNSAVNPSVIDPSTLRAASSMVLEGDGACRRRPGFVRVVAPGKPAATAAHWYDTPELETLILCRGGSLFSYPGDTEGFEETPIGISGLGSGRVQLAQLVSTLFVARPEGGLAWTRFADGTWTTGTTVAHDSQGDLPRFGFVSTHAFRLFAVEADTDTLWVSDILSAESPEAWSPLRTVRIGTGEGDPITAILPFQEQGLLVLKEHSAWLLDASGADPALWAVRKLTGLAGCIAGRTAVQLGQDVLFLSRLGVMSLSALSRSDSVSTASSVSAPVRADIDRINWSQVSGSFAGVWRQHYLLAALRDNEAEPSTLLAYNTETKMWSGLWPMPQASLSGACVTRMGGRQETMLLTSDGGVWRLDPRSATDGLADGWVDCSAETKSFDWEAGHVGKRLMRMEITMECRSDADVSVRLRPDQGTPVSVEDLLIYRSRCRVPVTVPLRLDRTETIRKAWNLRPLVGKPVREVSVIVSASSRGSFALGGVTLSACAEGVR
jgi:hypothetical protein